MYWEELFFKKENHHTFFPQRLWRQVSNVHHENSVCKDCKINPGIKKQINKTLYRVRLKKAVLFSGQKWGCRLVFQKSHKFCICPKWEIIILLNNKLKMNPLLSLYNFSKYLWCGLCSQSAIHQLMNERSILWVCVYNYPKWKCKNKVKKYFKKLNFWTKNKLMSCRVSHMLVVLALAP